MSHDIVQRPAPPPRRPLRLAVYVLATVLGALLLVGLAWYVWRRGVAPTPTVGLVVPVGARPAGGPGAGALSAVPISWPASCEERPGCLPGAGRLMRV